MMISNIHSVTHLVTVFHRFYGSGRTPHCAEDVQGEEYGAVTLDVTPPMPVG